ncbi:MAG: T9SS type A sorting domain-containing protein [Dysgonamonadaceae bacterium]|jgi:predicted outer membrane repeat protein|nr:T9SS type A sorting domain-containing protein [Dysgonamonadaceae bacterium]
MEDVIHVKGIIKITEEPDFATKIEDGTQEPPAPENGIYLYHRGYFFRNALKIAGITFAGEDPANDGFSGEEQAALFQFQGANPVTFKNLVFMKAVTHRAANGQYGSDASAFWVSGTELTFENCVFTRNDISRNPDSPADPRDGWGDRGALTINSGDVTFRGCEFTENTGKEGGALFLSAGNIVIDDCYFGYNNCAEINGSKGGAIHTWVHGADGTLNITITKSTFEGNTAKSGGAIALLDKVSYQPTGTTLNIDRCTFIGNQALQDQGGAILLDNFMGRQSSDIVTISNSLFYDNNAGSDGGCICIWNVQPNSQFKLINSTLFGNFTNGNPGHGGGLSFMTGYETYLPVNLQKSIYNTIIDGNYALDGGTRYSDLSALYTVEDFPAENFEVKNSYVGHTVNMTGKAGIDPALNNIDYYTDEEYDEGVAAGLDDAIYYATNYHAVPLLEDAATRTFGNPEYLIGDRDLSGKPRTVADGKCAIGACEVTATELDDEVDFGTGIFSPSNTGAAVKLTVSNRMIVCLTNEPADIELYDLTGHKIAAGRNYIAAQGISSGVYIAKFRTGNSEYKQKLILHD